MPPFTTRNVMKYVAKALVASKAADLTSDAITDHTHFEEDDLTVDLGSKVIGWYISEKLEPYTDKMVDKAADFVSTLRTKKQDKNTTE